MAQECIICGKNTKTGNQVSHSNVRTKRKWKPNIQKVKVLIKGTPQKVNVCTRCLKAGRVQRAL